MGGRCGDIVRRNVGEFERASRTFIRDVQSILAVTAYTQKIACQMHWLQ